MERLLVLIYVAENDGTQIQVEKNIRGETVYKTIKNQMIIKTLENGITSMTYVSMPEKNGFMKLYFPDGSLKTYVLIKDGLLHGKYYDFYESGELRMESTFIQDKLNGTATEYYMSGTVKHTVEMSNSMMNGVKKSFTETEKKISEEVYQNNVLLRKRTYYENDAIYQDDVIRDNVKHGLCKTYYPDGSLKHSCNYVGGKKHGVEIVWDQMGNQIQRSKYTDDVKV